MKNAFERRKRAEVGGVPGRFEAAVAGRGGGGEAFALALNAAPTKLKEFIKQKVLPGVGQ